MMTSINQIVSQFSSKVVFPTKFEISPAESAAIFGCGFVAYGILSRLFKKIKNVQLEREVRNLKALRIKDEEKHEKELEDQSECYRILRQMDARKISKAQSRCSELTKAYRDLEENYGALEDHCGALEEHCEALEGNYDVLEEQYKDLETRYENSRPLDDDETILSEEEQEEEEQEEEEQDEEEQKEQEEEEEQKPEEQNLIVERRLWSNAEKANGTYADQLPDGFQAYLNSCNQVMNLTFKKGDSKEENRWIINETGVAYPSLNQARAAFFGDDLKTKQSVWLSVRSAEDGRRLRNVIEG
jgi:hypothetical protein